MASKDGSIENDLLVVSKEHDIESAEGSSLMKNVKFEKIPADDHLLYFYQHMKALLKKRALYFLRDKKAQIFLSILLLMLMALSQFPSVLQVSIYRKHNISSRAN